MIRSHGVVPAAQDTGTGTRTAQGPSLTRRGCHRSEGGQSQSRGARDIFFFARNVTTAIGDWGLPAMPRGPHHAMDPLSPSLSHRPLQQQKPFPHTSWRNNWNKYNGKHGGYKCGSAGCAPPLTRKAAQDARSAARGSAQRHKGSWVRQTLRAWMYKLCSYLHLSCQQR
jgi:hypothetical protein